MTRPRMIISNPDVFASKWKKFCSDGLNRLLVISDFDQTLTTQFQSNGERNTSSHGLLLSSSCMNPAVREKERILYEKYYPIETSPTLTQAEKLPMMIDWWTQAHDILIEHQLTYSQLVQAVEARTLTFRAGFHSMFHYLASHQVPTFIFSAGLYDVIHAVLEKEFHTHGSSSTPSNVHVVANMMHFDEQQVLQSFQGKLIHCFNKDATVLVDSPFYEQARLENRRNILLLGDSRGDVNMTHGLESSDGEILRIGFLNIHVQDVLEEYLDLYDVVLTHDASLVPIELLLNQMSEVLK